MRIGTNTVVAIGVLSLVAIMVGAIAHQDFSWWVFPFSLLFGTIFAGILDLCFLNFHGDRFRQASLGDYPNEPWMWDARWRSGTMISRSKSEFWGFLAGTIILSMFALIGVVTLIKGLPQGNLWVLLNILPIAGAFYFGRKVYVAGRTWQSEKQVTITNQTRPAWVGSRFSAVIEAETQLKASHVEAWLEHFKVIRLEESDGIAFEKVIDRKLPGQIEHTDDGNVRVSVDIPEKSPATSWGETEQKRWWDLVVAINISGKNVSLRYEVPVADPEKHQYSEG